MNNRKTRHVRLVQMTSVVMTGLLLWSCTNGDKKGDVTISLFKGRGGPSRSSNVTAGGTVVPFSDQEAFNYLNQNCASCHSPDGAYKSNWEMPAKDKLSITSLEGVAGITRAYQALLNKYNGNEGASPSAMPLGVDFAANAQAKKDAERMLKWFAERMPGVVQDAKSLYPVDEKSGISAVTTSEVKVSLNYKCKQLRNGASYLTKLTSSLFNRNPTQAELDLISGKAEMPLTAAERKELAARIKTDPASMTEFENVGLRNFAYKIADAAKIMTADIDAAANRVAIQNDLKQEFYQLLKKYYRTKSYRDILLLDKVMVTSRTAPLYTGCTAPTAPAVWAECTLPPDRGNFFGTVAYMRAKPSSFLENGNNYGRAGAMFVVASGEALLPQTNGPTGDTVKGLPECLTNSTKDARARVKPNAQAGVDEPLTGPFGSLTVPGFGNVCQGCHVRRGLAAGSKVYRSFGKFGEKITEATLDGACGTPSAANACPGAANNPYRDDMLEAIKNDKAYYDNGQQRFVVDGKVGKARDATADKTSPVTVEYLKSLLRETTDNPGTCIPVDSKTVKPVTSIKDMAEFVVGSESNVARGLARLLPKAIAGTAATNQEVIMEVSKASNEKVDVSELLGKPAGSEVKTGLLSEMIIAYLSTETFSCQEE